MLLLSVPALLLTVCYILLFIAVLALILYFFEKLVMPIGQPIKGIIMFIVLIILIIWAMTNHGISF